MLNLLFQKSLTQIINVEKENNPYIHFEYSRSAALPDITRFSKWFRLLGATSCIIEAKKRWMKSKENSKFQNHLDAQYLWFSEIQRASFSKEIYALNISSSISRNSHLLKLSPFLDERGLMRVKGRIEFSPENICKVQPIILCAKHPVTQLLIKNDQMKFNKYFGLSI